MDASSIYPTLNLVWLASFDPDTGTGVPAPINQFLIQTQLGRPLVQGRRREHILEVT